MSDDTIYREDAIKALKSMLSDDINTSILFFWQNQTVGRGIDKIKNLPSADRPQGEWLDYEIPLEDGGSMPIQVCNLCKTFYPLAYTGGGHRFCPNCGARMKGADDE